MGQLVNKRQLAEVLDVSERSLTDWQADGMPVVEFGDTRGEANTYDTGAVVRWMIEREASRRVGKSAFDKLNEIRAKREELGYQREVGEIVNRSDIAPAFQRYVADTLSLLIGLPDKYAQLMEVTQGVDGKHQLLRELIEEVRDCLGNYEFCTKAAAGNDPRVSQSAEDHAGAVG